MAECYTSLGKLRENRSLAAMEILPSNVSDSVIAAQYGREFAICEWFSQRRRVRCGKDVQIVRLPQYDLEIGLGLQYILSSFTTTSTRVHPRDPCHAVSVSC
jgi:hypothetical protein